MLVNGMNIIWLDRSMKTRVREIWCSMVVHVRSWRRVSLN